MDSLSSTPEKERPTGGGDIPPPTVDIRDEIIKELELTIPPHWMTAKLHNMLDKYHKASE